MSEQISQHEQPVDTDGNINPRHDAIGRSPRLGDSNETTMSEHSNELPKVGSVETDEEMKRLSGRVIELMGEISNYTGKPSADSIMPRFWLSLPEQKADFQGMINHLEKELDFLTGLRSAIEIAAENNLGIQFVTSSLWFAAKGLSRDPSDRE